MIKNTFQGLWPVLHTPYTASQEIDWDAVGRELDYLESAKVQGITLALASDWLRLDHAERRDLIQYVVQHLDGRLPVVVSVGAESTRQAVKNAERATELGAAAVMAIPPLTHPAPLNALKTYFSSIVEAVEIPLFIQDASGYVGSGLPVSFQAELFHRHGPDRICFKPEASPVGPILTELRDAIGEEGVIFEGSGGILLLDSFRRGVDGSMPGSDLIHALAAVWQALKAGNEEKAYPLSQAVGAVVALQLQGGLDGFLSLERHILTRRGVFASAQMREPSRPILDGPTIAELDRLLERLDALIADS